MLAGQIGGSETEMKNNRYEKVIPFIVDDSIFLTVWVFCFFYTIATKLRVISWDILFLIASSYFVQFAFNLYNIIYDIRKCNLVTERVFISFIKEKRFEGFTFKRYFYLHCNKVKGKRYTGEILELKSKNNFELVEGAFSDITYYKKAKILYSVINNSEV